MTADIRIGTSGWHYKHWVGRYYPQGIKSSELLGHYLRDFDSVELNNSFYRLPEESAFDAWRDAVPDDFVFAVKGSRFLTHMIKLKDPARGLINFIPRAQRLGEKLGPILWQLPPGWNVNLERLEEFLELLPPEHRYAFELRNATWMTDRVYEVLRRYNAAFCIYELAGYSTDHVMTADWTYVRLHGPTLHKYQGSYTDAQLAAWAERIEGWKRKLGAVYVYFDNDDSAHAVTNALTLKTMLASSAGRRRSAAGRGRG